MATCLAKALLFSVFVAAVDVHPILIALRRPNGSRFWIHRSPFFSFPFPPTEKIKFFGNSDEQVKIAEQDADEDDDSDEENNPRNRSRTDATMEEFGDLKEACHWFEGNDIEANMNGVQCKCYDDYVRLQNPERCVKKKDLEAAGVQITEKDEKIEKLRKEILDLKRQNFLKKSRIRVLEAIMKMRSKELIKLKQRSAGVNENDDKTKGIPKQKKKIDVADNMKASLKQKKIIHDLQHETINPPDQSKGSHTDGQVQTTEEDLINNVNNDVNKEREKQEKIIKKMLTEHGIDDKSKTKETEKEIPLKNKPENIDISYFKEKLLSSIGKGQEKNDANDNNKSFKTRKTEIEKTSHDENISKLSKNKILQQVPST